MGYSSASDMLANTDLRTAVSWHFSTNCYPPIPQQMVDTAIEAIEYYNDGRRDEPVWLPDGVTYRGLTVVSTLDIIDSYRLYAFIEDEDY